MPCYFTRRQLKKKSFIIFFAMLGSIGIFFMMFDEKLSMYTRVAPLNIPNVVVHIDLKGSPPKIEYLESLIPLLKEYGADGLLMEYEDMFPYKNQLEVVKARNAYSEQDLSRFLKSAAALGMQVIPFIQTFGHMEFVLKLAQFRHLREHDDYVDSICPSNNGSKALIAEMLKQVIDFHNKIVQLKHIHIGCDEVFHMMECDKCNSASDSRPKIFAEHVKFVKDTVQKLTPDTKVLIWDDMMRGIDDEKIKHMPIKNIEPVYWDYSKNLQVFYPDIIKYQMNFDNVWVASAFKGAEGRAATLPDFKTRFSNNHNWLKLLSYYNSYNFSYRFKGIILTGWSKYAHMDPPCETLQASLQGLILDLILIQKFKEGFSYSFRKGPSYSKFVADFDEYDCHNPPQGSISELRCDSKMLITTFERFANIRQEVLQYFYNDKNGLYTIEYYQTTNINLNLLNSIIPWCLKIKHFVKYFETSAREIMSKAYDKDFIDEYLSLKIYEIVNRVNTILNIAKNYKDRKVWTVDKPIIRNFRNLTDPLQEKELLLLLTL